MSSHHRSPSGSGSRSGSGSGSGTRKSIYINSNSELRSNSSQMALRSINAKYGPAVSAPEKFLYIGIDFGTTYSGAAWAWSGDPDNVNIVTNWGTRGLNLSHIRDDAKAPTTLYYHQDSVHWGHSITENEDPLRWFKLLLLKEDDIPQDVRNSEYLRDARIRLKEAKKTPVEAVSDYLRLLWNHTIASMKRARGANAVEGLPFKVVLTVPAIWQPYAYAKMQEAAKKAGILDHRYCGKTSLQLVSEPEAAALATLHEFRDRHDVQKGDVYVVCDIGGGTADIISYKIQETNPMVLNECVEGDGKLSGAIFVDESFQNIIQKRIGPKVWDKLSRSSKVKLMNDEWEFGIKRAFDGEPGRHWTVQLPPDAVPKIALHRLNDNRSDAPMVHGQIQFGTGHIKGVFGKVIGEIRGLINGQIRKIEEKEGKKPKALILVGGFGACEYLYQTLYKEHEEDGIEVLQSSGKGPWTAICRGAVIRAASNVVRSRISRYSYGITFNTEFIDGIHDENDRIWDKLRCRWMAKDQMQWYVTKGQNIDALKPLKFPFVKTLEAPPVARVHNVHILQCGVDPPPGVKTPDVTGLCSIKCNVDISWADLPVHTNPEGSSFREIPFELEMVKEDASLNFVANFGEDNKTSMKVDVDFDS